jgi:Sulfotransferase family
MANTIEITDLLNPVLTAMQRGALDSTAAQPVIFTQSAVLEAAKAETGLSDFGPPDFRERLDVWLKAIDEDREASSVTRASLFQMCVRYAATRLRVEDFIAQHPEAREVMIDRPIIVAGLPRSGTTHLLNLLSADQRLRSLPWWEAIAPIPDPREVHVTGQRDPRWTRAEAGWNQQDAMLPHLKAMHEFSPDHVSEDVEFQAIDFSSYLIEWLARTPRWRDYYLSHDQTSTYAYLKKVMQAVTLLKGPNRWVTKCPQHMEQLPVVHSVFPDATIVITHRDPVASIQSAITMSCYAARLLRTRVDPQGDAEYWIDRYERLLRRCVRDRDTLPDSSVLDVHFHELMADTDSVLKQIYAKAGMTLTPSALRELHQFLADHPRGRYGQVQYNLRRDFGLQPDAIRERFKFYLDRFAVPVEVK